MDCKADAKIFSAFVTKEQHANICVKPRMETIKFQSKEDREKCVLRPCECKVFEREFVALYGLEEYNNGMTLLQNKCKEWCTTGLKPKGVIDEKAANKAIESNKNDLLKMYGSLFEWMKNFLKYGKIFGDLVLKGAEFAKKGALIVGEGAKKGAEYAKKGALIVGEGAKKAGKEIAKGASQAAKTIARGGRMVVSRAGAGIKKAASKIKRFFRRW